MVVSAYFVTSTSPRAFSISRSVVCRHVTDILQMYIKNYYAGKNNLTNLQLFELRQFSIISNIQ